MRRHRISLLHPTTARAGHTSVLFFCVADMAAIDPMYQYSLAYFTSLFLHAIDMAERDKAVAARLHSLRDTFTFFLYTNICRSLFQEHKLLFAFNLATKLALAAGDVIQAQVNFLLTGGVARDAPQPNPAPGALADKAWGEVCRASDLGGRLEGLRDAVAANAPAWLECAPPLVTWRARVPASKQARALHCAAPHRRVARPLGQQGRLCQQVRMHNPRECRVQASPKHAVLCRLVAAKDPHCASLPPPWGGRLTPFERLIVLRCLRPDKLVPGIQNFTVHSLGTRYVEPQAFRLEPIYADSVPRVPLIFVLSPGADPMADLLMFAESKGKRVEAVSLGQGQGPVAEKWVKEGIANGFWVVLQNCHLAKSFLPRCAAARALAVLLGTRVALHVILQICRSETLPA
jgi:dynein heavy chain, axonemal